MERRTAGVDWGDRRGAAWRRAATLAGAPIMGLVLAATLAVRAESPAPRPPAPVPAAGLPPSPPAAAPASAGGWCFAPPAALPGAAARLLPGLGRTHVPIRTADPQVQRWFDQGLVLGFGFNFAEAERSFRAAAARDPDCAMCWWGVAWALGPSVNHDIDARTAAAAREAVARARSLAAGASAREAGLIEALALRYPEPPAAGPVDDQAYAAALAALLRRWPRDPDLLTWTAEALMAPRGRAYWQRDGRPEPWTPAIVALLERALRIAPRHVGAAHLHVHVFEDAPRPQRAWSSALVLRDAAPGVAHLVHMPSHLELRLGRYAEAIASNRRAIAADRAYLAGGGADPAYLAGYVVHNHHFLWVAAMLGGHERDAIDAAQAIAVAAGVGATGDPADGTAQHFAVAPLYTALRFGRWDELRSAPRPQPVQPYTDAVWHGARALAARHAGDLDAAGRALAQLDAARGALAASGLQLKRTHALAQLADIFRGQVAAELAAAAGDPVQAIALARAAVAAADALEPDEPPAWHHPPRHTLGALLLAAGRARDAQAVFRADLARHPHNPWAGAGLAAAQRAARGGSAGTGAPVPAGPGRGRPALSPRWPAGRRQAGPRNAPGRRCRR